ncbi:MAG: YlmC/YmxH family sporulation protein [Acidobacteriota bacterium]
MLLSELIGKEIININDGIKLGVVGDSDLIINPENGEIESIIMPNRGNFVNLWIDRQRMVVPWDAVRKIGREVIVVDLDQTHLRMRSSSF